MEENTRARQAQQESPPDPAKQIEIVPEAEDDQELEGGEAPCWLHMLDEDGRLP